MILKVCGANVAFIAQGGITLREQMLCNKCDDFGRMIKPCVSIHLVLNTRVATMPHS